MITHCNTHTVSGGADEAGDCLGHCPTCGTHYVVVGDYCACPTCHKCPECGSPAGELGCHWAWCSRSDEVDEED